MSTWLNVNGKQRLLDQYIQKRRSDVDTGVKCYAYRLFKTEFTFENYSTDLPDALKYIVCKFHIVNHKLPIETRIKRNGRACRMCSGSQLEDEFHFSMQCPALK